MHIIFNTLGGVGLYFSYNVFAWIITSIIIALGLWQITLNQKIYYSKMLLWLTLGCICLIIPVFYNFEFTDHAIPRILALIGGLLFLFSFYQFKLVKSDAFQLLYLILIAVLIQSLFGLIQFFFFEAGDWGGYIVGESRPHGVFLQPNVMASFMATGFAITLFISAQVKTRNKHFLHLLLIVFSLFLTTFLLVLLQSRTGFLAAIIVLLLTTPYLYRSNKKQCYLNYMVIVFTTIIAFITLTNSTGTMRQDDPYQSVGGRKAEFLITLDMIKEKPIFGFGYGGFERGYIDHHHKYAVENPEVGQVITRLSHPHNEVLFWVSEGGVVTLLAFIFFTIGYLITWRKIPINQAVLILALVFPILLHTQLEFPFYSSTAHWLVFLIMLWLVDLYARTDNKEFEYISYPRTFLIRFFAIFIPLIFIPFLVTTLHTASILFKYEKSSIKSLDRFSDIINPIAWQSRLDAAVYTNILISGIKEKNVNKLKTYLDWATKRIRHKPRVILYQNCLLILKALGENKAHQLLLKEAKRTYPHIKSWKSNILQAENSTK